MSKRITNRYNATSFTAEENEPVLQAALRNGHLYPYGCQAGACGACKAKLTKGTIKHLHRDKTVLSDADRAAGFCLLCQALALEDIEIDVKEIAKVKSIEIKTLPVRVREKNMLAKDVVQLILQLPKAQNFEFLPGQYIDILLKNGKKRSFSIANASQEDSLIELHIRVVDDGHFSPTVRDTIQEKDILRIQGPFGTFFFRKDEQRPLIMVAGGTGFAPIKAIIEGLIQSVKAEPENARKRSIDLYWGARTEVDLYLDAQAKSWMSKLDNIRYIPVLSDLDNQSQWRGETGFVHDVILRQIKDLSKHSIYAAGPPIMIDALKTNLRKHKMDMDFFYFDAFDYAAQNE